MYFPLYFQESGKSIPCIKKNKNLETQRWYAAAVKCHEEKKVGSDFEFTKQINRRKKKDVTLCGRVSRCFALLFIELVRG